MVTLPKEDKKNLKEDEKNLSHILAHMLASLQDYPTLADELLRFLQQHPTLLLEILATYFELFATGYAHWQQSYDYPHIHEYFYGAYLQARRLAKGNYPDIITMLEEMTYAFIAYTGCENALINNDPQALARSAKEAIEHGEKAQKSREEADKQPSTSALDHELLKPINNYMQINLHLWRGLAICAEGYLRISKGKILSSSEQKDMDSHLDYLEEKSPELFSELNAHYAFVRQLNDLYGGKPKTIRIKRGTVFLRAIGYVGKEVVAAFFERFAKENSIDLCKDMQNQTQLPVQTIRSSYTMDIFETVLGKQFHQPIVFELSADDQTSNNQTPILTFKAHNKFYAIESIQITLNHLGTIAIEFSIPIEDASISHVRMLESLIGPHAGRFNFTWWDGSKNASKDPDNSAHNKHTSEDPDNPARDYTEIFLQCKKLKEEIKNTLSTKRWEDDLKQEIDGKMNSIDVILGEWEKNLEEISYNLPQYSAGVDNDKKEALRKEYKSLINHYTEISQLIDPLKQKVQNLQDSDNLPLAQLFELFPEGKTFGLLMGLAQFLLDATMNFLEQKYIEGFSAKERKNFQKNKGEEDIRYASSFDSYLGWQSIVECKQLLVIDTNGNELKYGPGTVLPYSEVLTYPEFKSFAIWPREARAGIDDWLFVTAPQIENLATIRSHTHDVLYVGSHKAFLWFPDDPQFLTDQYLETIRFIAEIRALVLTFNNNAKLQIDLLEKVLTNLKNRKGNNRKKIREELLERRSNIEIFHIYAERVLDLLRACTVSRYQDHSELLKRMLKASQADDSQASLENNIESISNLHTYISDSLKQRIDERTQSSQNRIGCLVFFLTIVSTVSALISVLPFIDTILLRASIIISHMPLVVFLIIGLALLIIGMLIFFILWRRKSA